MRINFITLKYIVALDIYRNFVRAAQSCGVTQPTLSAAIKNMETELDIVIFDRDSHPVKPTRTGEKIIEMARLVLRDVSMIEEFVLAEKGSEAGEVSVGIIPTVAPYVLPGLFREIRDSYPAVKLKVAEMRTSFLIEKLRSAELDMAILATPQKHNGLLEIPLYYERFIAYVSPDDDFYSLGEIPSDMLPSDRLWVLEEGHCFRNQVFGFCHGGRQTHAEYQAGSIGTLVNIVDRNGGYTVIPELHASLLSDVQSKNLRPIVCGRDGTVSGENVSGGHPGDKGNCCPVREVSLLIRDDFVRERLLNVIAGCIRRIIPDSMLDTRLKRFAIKI